MRYRVGSAAQLLQEPHVEGWNRELLGTTGTPAEDYLEGLHRFARHVDRHTEELLRIADSSRESLLERFREREEALGNDVRTSVRAVRSWVGYGKVR
jgi:hypothetical protein